MQVSFKANTITASKTPVNFGDDNKEGKNRGVFETGKEVWKDTLKGWEGVKAVGSGTVNGMKKAACAGSLLVALGWFGESMRNRVPFSEMIKTPVTLGAKAIYRGTKYAFNYLNIFNKNSPSTLQMITDTFKTVGKALNKIYHSKNVSPVTKWGLPIITTAIMGYTIVRSKLDYNERAAQIDHRYGGVHGHHDK